MLVKGYCPSFKTSSKSLAPANTRVMKPINKAWSRLRCNVASFPCFTLSRMMVKAATLRYRKV